MINPDLINLTPNPFASVTDSTTDEEIIDIALEYISKPNNKLCFKQGLDKPFLKTEAERLQNLFSFTKVANGELWGTWLDFTISDFGKEIIIYHKGWLNFIEHKSETEKLRRLKEQLEIENLKLSNENLKYQNDIKELNTKNLTLSIKNGKLETILKYKAIIWILVAVVGYILSHFEVLSLAIKAL